MTKTSLRIDLVSDVVCPWCIIGYKRLEKALEQVADDIEAEIHWHPFELNPLMAPDGENLRDHLAAKYGTTPEDSAKARENLIAIGEELGFSFDYFDDMRMVNTFKAHQLLHYARQQGLEEALKLRLFASFFSERKNVSDQETLVQEAVAVGLDADESRAVLEDGRFEQAVRQEQNYYTARGVQSVPTFIFNQKHGIAGAHPPETLADVMKQIAAAG